MEGYIYNFYIMSSFFVLGMKHESYFYAEKEN
jgi:hypothetical protein